MTAWGSPTLGSERLALEHGISRYIKPRLAWSFTLLPPTVVRRSSREEYPSLESTLGLLTPSECDLHFNEVVNCASRVGADGANLETAIKASVRAGNG